MVALDQPERVALCHPEHIRCTQGKLREGSIRGTTASLISVLMVALCHPERVALCHPERSEGSIRGTTASLKARTTLKERYQPSLLSTNYHITFPPKNML